MQVCLEHLYHYCCDSCIKWWTIADIEPKVEDTIYCPHCGAGNLVESIESYMNRDLAVNDSEK